MQYSNSGPDKRACCLRSVYLGCSHRATVEAMVAAKRSYGAHRGTPSFGPMGTYCVFLLFLSTGCHIARWHQISKANDAADSVSDAARRSDGPVWDGAVISDGSLDSDALVGPVDSQQADSGSDASVDQGWPAELLASLADTHIAGGGTTDQAVTIRLSWGLDPKCSGNGTLGATRTHLDGASGQFSFHSSNEPGFAAFVACLTNNEDNTLTSGVFLFPSGSGIQRMFREQDFAPDPPDLAGCTIHEVRLVLHSLSISPEGLFDADYEWQFRGDCGG